MNVCERVIFFKLWSKENLRDQALCQQAGFSAISRTLLTAYLLFTSAAGAARHTQDWTGVSWAGHCLGGAPKGSAQLGLRGKHPRLRG